MTKYIGNAYIPTMAESLNMLVSCFEKMEVV